MNESQYLSLAEWATAKFGANAPCLNTLRRWARDGIIVPKPQKIGRAYMVVPTARHMNEQPMGKLASRLHGIQTA